MTHYAIGKWLLLVEFSFYILQFHVLFHSHLGSLLQLSLTVLFIHYRHSITTNPLHFNYWILPFTVSFITTTGVHSIAIIIGYFDHSFHYFIIFHNSVTISNYFLFAFYLWLFHLEWLVLHCLLLLLFSLLVSSLISQIRLCPLLVLLHLTIKFYLILKRVRIRIILHYNSYGLILAIINAKPREKYMLVLSIR